MQDEGDTAPPELCGLILAKGASQYGPSLLWQ